MIVKQSTQPVLLSCRLLLSKKYLESKDIPWHKIHSQPVEPQVGSEVGSSNFNRARTDTVLCSSELESKPSHEARVQYKNVSHAASSYANDALSYQKPLTIAEG